jgi:hypothetical protein
VAEPPRNPEAGDEPGGALDVESAPGTPRWVKVLGLVALVVVVLFVILLLMGGHGPARHSFGDGDPPSSVRNEIPTR